MCKVMLPAKSVFFKTDVMVFTLTLNMFFLSSKIVGCIVFTFENRVPLMCYGLNGVAFLLQLMHNFNKTEAPIFHNDMLVLLWRL